jgi:hypothetical protein
MDGVAVFCTAGFLYLSILFLHSFYFLYAKVAGGQTHKLEITKAKDYSINTG